MIYFIRVPRGISTDSNRKYSRTACFLLGFVPDFNLELRISLFWSSIFLYIALKNIFFSKTKQDRKKVERQTIINYF